MSSRTGLPEYTDGGTTVWAAKITEIELRSGQSVLHFGEHGKECPLRPEWLKANPVEVGAYFVVFNTGGAGVMRAEDFSKRFRSAS